MIPWKYLERDGSWLFAAPENISFVLICLNKLDQHRVLRGVVILRIASECVGRTDTVTFRSRTKKKYTRALRISSRNLITNTEDIPWFIRYPRRVCFSKKLQKILRCGNTIINITSNSPSSKNNRLAPTKYRETLLQYYWKLCYANDP